MSHSLYCYFRNVSRAKDFVARVHPSFDIEGPQAVSEAPDRTRPVLVVVSEHDGADMTSRTEQTILRIVNLYDGEIREPQGTHGGTQRPGGAPFANGLPQSVLDDSPRD